MQVKTFSDTHTKKKTNTQNVHKKQPDMWTFHTSQYTNDQYFQLKLTHHVALRQYFAETRRHRLVFHGHEHGV